MIIGYPTTLSHTSHRGEPFPRLGMAKKISAGILSYRQRDGEIEVFLVRPGGPYYVGQDEGVWSIPKGELKPGEDALSAAKREFLEECGSTVAGEFYPLKTLQQPSGKIVYAFAVEGDIDAAAITSNLFSIEWPPRSGEIKIFPEVDRGAWFDGRIAHQKILPGQHGFIEELLMHANRHGGRAAFEQG
jgi:predicted NUDIX family NTP pyrophosphohydrolase